MFLIEPTDSTWKLAALVSTARIGNVFTFTAVWIIHPNLFPTLFNLTSMGITNVAARVLTLLAPMVAEIDFPTPMLVFTIINLVAALVSLLIEEQELKDEE